MTDTTEALKIVAENEWQVEELHHGPVELTIDDAQTLFAAIKQLNGDSERLDWLVLQISNIERTKYHEPSGFFVEDISEPANPTFKTLREAIDAAIRKDNQ